MIYTPRSQSVEAAPVELAGQRLMAIALDGKAHLVDASVFETLFESKTSVMDFPDGSEMKAKKEMAEGIRRAISSAKPKPKGDRISEMAQRCLNVLRQHGPLTTAELRDHVYSDLKDPRKRLQNFSALSLDMRRRGLIDRREEPATHLDKWHIVEASDGKR